MKNYYLLFIFGITLIATGQSKITFDYDPAGNQIKRELCIGNCDTNPFEEEDTKEIEELEEEDLQKFSPEDVISFYPNPVKEELYLKWELQNGNNVASIQLYTTNGQLLKAFNKPENANSQKIAFLNYPTGIYMISLIYSNGDQKTIRIIKQ